VRISESLCPFCGEAIPSEVREAGPVRLPKRRLGRAAKFAFGAAALSTVALSGCGDDEPAPMDTGTVAPPYGIPPMDSGPVDAGPDDSGPADSAPADASSDTGLGDGGGDGPLYGGPPDAG